MDLRIKQDEYQRIKNTFHLKNEFYSVVKTKASEGSRLKAFGSYRVLFIRQ